MSAGTKEAVAPALVSSATAVEDLEVYAVQSTVSTPAVSLSRADGVPEFVWSPELIASVAADMDRGADLLGRLRYDTRQRKWVPVAAKAAA